MTRRQIENSPPINTHRRVSRQHETASFDYYGYPYYWTGLLYGGSGLPLQPTGANGDEIGHVEDFIIDYESWFIRYIVVDTRNRWPGKNFAPPQRIEKVSWTDSMPEYTHRTPSIVITKRGFMSTTAGKATGSIDRLESS